MSHGTHMPELCRTVTLFRGTLRSERVILSRQRFFYFVCVNDSYMTLQYALSVVTQPPCLELIWFVTHCVCVTESYLTLQHMCLSLVTQ